MRKFGIVKFYGYDNKRAYVEMNELGEICRITETEYYAYLHQIEGTDDLVIWRYDANGDIKAMKKEI